MKYNNIVEGKFILRRNRFIAEVEINGKREIAHVKNTGRLKELLISGSRIYLQIADNPCRKTKYDLIAVRKDNRLINIDSQVPNTVVAEWIQDGCLFPDLTMLKREVTYGDSRFDLYAEHGGKKAFIEVKGVTLEENGIARFPDAPTERGVKHLKELIRCIDNGFEAYIIFLIQMQGISQFEPNRKTHPEFADALKEAYNAGVHILAYDSITEPDSIVLNESVPVRI